MWLLRLISSTQAVAFGCTRTTRLLRSKPADRSCIALRHALRAAPQQSFEAHKLSRHSNHFHGHRNWVNMCVRLASESCVARYTPFGCLQRELSNIAWTGAWPFLGLSPPQQVGGTGHGLGRRLNGWPVPLTQLYHVPAYVPALASPHAECNTGLSCGCGWGQQGAACWRSGRCRHGLCPG